MAWSQSAFLQALGWATLNSLWQMALLWCIYLCANHYFRLSAQAKYKFSVAAVVGGFVWFCFTLVLYKQQSFSLTPLSHNTIAPSAGFLNILLISASATYLLLLIFPAYKLIQNWRFVHHIKKDGLRKAKLEYRLFVQKLSSQLSIGKKVSVYISDLVASPLTIGYLKPVILLPVAAVNNLSVAQAEAVLLHELSHIKRCDYILNFLTTIIHTILYFNPFVKLFMAEIETERENCCDEMVLQYGYDRVGYASALLSLEKSSAQKQVLVLNVTGKKNLITRIEKIVGMEQKKRYSLAQLVPVLGAVICILLFNSILIMKDGNKANSIAFESATVVNPFYLIETGTSENLRLQPVITPVTDGPLQHHVATKQNTLNTPSITVEVNNFSLPPEEPGEIMKGEPAADFRTVAFDEVETSLTKKQQEQVKTTVDATKKVLTTLQWQEVETSMADALNKSEKEIAKQEYLKEIEKLNWANIEKNLRVNYENIDWNKIYNTLGTALTAIQLDSLQKAYTQLLCQLEKTESQVCSAKKSKLNALPDQSVADIKTAKEEVCKRLEEVKRLRKKPVIRL